MDRDLKIQLFLIGTTVVASFVALVATEASANSVDLEIINNEWADSDFYSEDNIYNITMNVDCQCTYIVTFKVMSEGEMVDKGDFLAWLYGDNIPLTFTEVSNGVFVSEKTSASLLTLSVSPQEGSLDLSNVICEIEAKVSR